MRNGIVTHINDQNIAGFRAASKLLSNNGVLITTAQVSPTSLNAIRTLVEGMFRPGRRENSVLQLLLKMKGVSFIVIKPAEFVCLRPVLALAIWIIAKIKGIEIICSWENCLWNLREINNLASRFGMFIGMALLKTRGVRHFAASKACAGDVMDWAGIESCVLYQAPDVPSKFLMDGLQDPSDQPYVINIATPRTRKGIDLFIRVAQLCVASHPSVRFIWIGGQPGPEFQTLLESTNLGNRLVFSNTGTATV